MCLRNLGVNRNERIYFKDAHGRFLFASAGWLATDGRGRSLDDVIGRTDLELFGPDHARAALEDEREVLEAGRPIIARLGRRTFEDRPDAWISTTMLPVHDEDGDVIGVRGVVLDVTEEIEREEDLRRHAEGQKEIADLGRLALRGTPLEDLLDCAVGAAWRVLSSDCAWLLECQPDGMAPILEAQVGWHDIQKGDRLPEEARSVSGYVMQSNRQALVTDWHDERRFAPSHRRHARGMRSSVSVFIGEPDSPFGVLEVDYLEPGSVPSDCISFLNVLASVVGEAIQSRRAQELIRRQSDSLAAMADSLGGLVREKERLIEQIPGVVMVFDAYPDGSRRYFYVSPRSSTILGVAPAEFLADPRRFTDHLHVEDLDSHQAARHIPEGSGADPLPAELRWSRPDGSEVWLHEEATVIDRAGEFDRVQSVLFDITASKLAERAQKRLELDLRLAQKLEAVGQLAAGIAHEINTPVQFIGDSIRFLKEANDDLMTLTAAYHDLLDSEEPIEQAERQRRAVAAEEAADLEYLTTRVPAAFERALDGIERVTSIVRAMRQFAHPSTDRASIDMNRGSVRR